MILESILWTNFDIIKVICFEEKRYNISSCYRIMYLTHCQYVLFCIWLVNIIITEVQQTYNHVQIEQKQAVWLRPSSNDNFR